MSSLMLYLVNLAVILSCCEAYKILVVFPMPGRSHANLGDGIVRHLANDGHEVTYISPFSYKPAHPNVRIIDVSENLKLMSDDVINIDVIMKDQLDLSSHAFAFYFFSGMMRTSFENENVQKLINDPKEQFDAVIVEWMYSELPAGLAAVFDCPLILFSSMDVHWMVLRLIDQSPNPAYSGDPVTTAMPPFTFWERANQLFIQIKALLFKYAIFDIMESRAYEAVLAPAITKRGRQPPSFNDVKFNASLLLTNSHTSLSTALTIPQNSIAIGGYHIEEEVKPLPEKMTVLSYFFFCLAILSFSCDAYKALVVFPMPSKSHGILGDGIVKHLLNDGNEVVYIRSFEYKNAPPTLRQIDVSENANAMPASALNITHILEKKHIPNNYDLIMRIMISVVQKTLEVKELQALLNDPKEHFDVVIVEWMFSDVLSGLAKVFDCPLIWVSPMEVNIAVLSLIDAAPNPAYNADSLSSNTAPFTFEQRLEELWTRLKKSYWNYMYYDDMQEKEYNRFIVPHIIKRGRQPPSFSDARYNASMVLGNSYLSMGEAVRLPQNYKHIGGYHIEENVKPLPEDLKKVIEAAKHGVIYFSMGSNLKSKDWPEEIKKNLLKMFGELKQTVLWKFEEDLPNVPKNVHILKWAPQPSILSHPNCLLFISHGGLLSTTETIHYGVPIIGIPVFGDQFLNVRRAVNKGFALKVDLTYTVAEDLKVSIKEMLSNPKYREKVKELSYIYHDRPVKPAQTLTHWVRHVVKTRGASHLRSPAVNIPLYERLYFDLVCLLVIAIVIVSKLLKVLCAVVCTKKKVDTKKKTR